MQFTSEPVVAIENANIKQDRENVLENVNLKISKGEFVYLIGKTGSGKSSLLKTLYADLDLEEGNAEVAGYAIKGIARKKVPYLRRKIGIVFQDFQLFDDRNVSDNLLFVMKATGWKNKAKMKERLSEVLMQVSLGSVASKMPHQLSGGEQQRIVIARALINEPQILFADEPTGNLDPEVSDGIMKIFQNINNTGTAILMATHDYDFVKNYPARILKCENNRVLDSNVDEFDLKNVW